MRMCAESDTRSQALHFCELSMRYTKPPMIRIFSLCVRRKIVYQSRNESLSFSQRALSRILQQHFEKRGRFFRLPCFVQVLQANRPVYNLIRWRRTTCASCPRHSVRASAFAQKYASQWRRWPKLFLGAIFFGFRRATVFWCGTPSLEAQNV